MEIRDQIFFGSPSGMIEAYYLHRRLEEAFEIIGGIQQPQPCTDPPEAHKEFEDLFQEGQRDVEIIALEIVRGLLGKEFTIAKDETEILRTLE